MSEMHMKVRGGVDRPLLPWLIFTGILVLLFLSVIAAVSMGAVSISWQDIIKIESFHLFGMNGSDPAVVSVKDDIIWNLRMPRTILAIVVGMGLAVSGTVMQATVRNVLADPYILGISSGASLGATFSIMLGLGKIFGPESIGVCAFIGSLLVSVLVLMIAGQKASPIKLILAGMAVSAVCSALSSFIVFSANNKEGMQTITYWLMGSLGNATWSEDIVLLPMVLVMTVLFMTQSRMLNLMLLGDETTITLGVKISMYRKLYIIGVSLIIGFIVYASGMIGFVGLIVPHCIRNLVGVNHKYLIPVSSVAGALFLVWADILCRTILPGSEIPIGVLVAIVAAPFFLYLLAQKKYTFGG